LPPGTRSCAGPRSTSCPPRSHRATGLSVAVRGCATPLQLRLRSRGRVLVMPAALQYLGRLVIRLLDRKPCPDRAAVSWLATLRQARWERLRSQRGLGWIRGRLRGGVGPVRAALRFWVPDTGLQGLGLRAG